MRIEHHVPFQSLLSKLLVLLTCISVVSPAIASDGHEDQSATEELNVGDIIMHHILDSHDWHLFDLRNDDGSLHAVSIPLPVILYHKGQGLKVFSSSKFEHGHATHQNYANNHEHIEYMNPDGTVNEAETANIIDFSITKNVVTLFLVIGLMLWLFIKVAKTYGRNPEVAPKGVQGFFEPIIVFIRDEVAIAVIGEKHYKRFMPFLLTVFFFIWIGNMLGLVPFLPGGANLTGNISVALVLAAFAFIMIMINANKNYWQHVFAMPGVPLPILFILTPIELIGVFLKPIVLMVRLFANITAGHITILAFICLIFIMGQVSPAAGYGMSVVSILLSMVMFFLELLVAFLQAFIFTLLSATYFSAATEEAHH